MFCKLDFSWKSDATRNEATQPSSWWDRAKKTRGRPRKSTEVELAKLKGYVKTAKKVQAQFCHRGPNVLVEKTTGEEKQTKEKSR